MGHPIVFNGPWTRFDHPVSLLFKMFFTALFKKCGMQGKNVLYTTKNYPHEGSWAGVGNFFRPRAVFENFLAR